MTDQEQTDYGSLVKEANGIPYVEIDDVLSDEELAEAWKTIDALEISALSRDPIVTGLTPAVRPDDPLMSEELKRKQNYSMYLTSLYTQDMVGHCKLAKVLVPKWEEVKFVLANANPAFRPLATRGGMNMMINYYGDGDRYESHTDESSVSTIFCLAKDPEKFTGGDLVLEDGETTIEFKNNSMIIMPGYMSHAVTPVGVRLEDERAGLGRWSVGIFV